MNISEMVIIMVIITMYNSHSNNRGDNNKIYFSMEINGNKDMD